MFCNEAKNMRSVLKPNFFGSKVGFVTALHTHIYKYIYACVCVFSSMQLQVVHHLRSHELMENHRLHLQKKSRDCQACNFLLDLHDIFLNI